MKHLFLLFLLLIPAGCNQELHSTQIHEQTEKIVTQLNSPWSIDYDGENFFISEKAGTIVKAGRMEN